jgi:hypothetical protein
MRPWRDTNNTGRVLIVMSLVNVICAMVLASDNLLIESMLSFGVAMYCGVSTFNEKYDRLE